MNNHILTERNSALAMTVFSHAYKNVFVFNNVRIRLSKGIKQPTTLLGGWIEKLN